MKFRYFLLASLAVHTLTVWGFDEFALLVPQGGTALSLPYSVSHSVFLQFKNKEQEIQEKQQVGETVKKEDKKESKTKKEAQQVKRQEKKQEIKQDTAKQDTIKNDIKNIAEKKGGMDDIIENIEPVTMQDPVQEELRIGQKNAPQYAHFTAPEYPRQARQRNIEGLVLLRVLIDEEGKAREVEVISSSHSLLTKAAKKSVLKSSYLPARRAGIAVATWVQIPIRFELR